MSNNDESFAGAVDDEAVNLLPYHNKIATITKQLININMALNAVQLAQYDDAELSVRLEFVESLNSSFDKAQTILEELDSSVMEGNNRYNFVAIYLEVKAKLTRRLNSIRNTEPNQRFSTFRQFSVDETHLSSCLPHRRSRLPELKIPPFSGSYLDWPDFFAMFTTVVEKDDITKLEKFQHLRACLEGAALSTISSLEPSDANYDKAIELLKKRFDNKLVNFQAHIKEIFGLKCAEKGCALSLRQLSDKLNAHMRALQTMSTKEQIADGFLVHLVSSKLDLKSQSKWEEVLPIDSLPTWSSMESFLERRCRMLENLESSVSTRELNPPTTKKSLSGRNVLVASVSATSLCTFCDSMEHYITQCSRFGSLSPTNRHKEAKRLQLCLNCLRKGHMLKNCNSGHCRHCPSKHHTLLHIGNNESISGTPGLDEQNSQSLSALVSSASSSAPQEVESPPPTFNALLATAVILVKHRSGSFIPCRAVLDSASQLNFITGHLANQLQLPTNKSSMTISGIGDGTFVADKTVDVCVKSQHGDYTNSFSAFVVPTITDYKPNININVSGWNIPENVQLADTLFNKPGRVDILIGAGIFFELLCVGQIRMAKGLPILQKTVFGWVVAGGGVCASNSWSLTATCKYVQQKGVDNIDVLIKSFWEVENNFDGISVETNDNVFCESYFQQTTTRLNSGEYSVSLPKIKDSSLLGDSYERALQRFKSLEKKLNKNLEIKKQYSDFIKEYADLKHMSLVSSPPREKTYYLPHHCVFKEDSTTTKLRVVFDGSAKTSTGFSLNDILCAGPTIQPKLFNTLLRFRFFKVALSGDICKMYRCVKVSYPDDYLQCILWRENAYEDIKVYKLNTVTYGTKPAAFLAIRAMHQLTYDEEHNFPLGADIVRRDFYVDDMISGGDSVDDVIKIRQQVTNLLQKGNFVIRKWCSNDSSALDGISSLDCEQFLKFHDGTDVTKTLGLVWNPKTDSFIFSFSPSLNGNIVTKRSVLSAIARLYDPLGLIGPIITKAKVFMQILWKHNLHWDESLPQELHTAWVDFISKFSIVDSFIFPRFVSMPKAVVQIHAFCDASLSAYGVCVYARSELNGVVKINLLCSKSRVSPLKTLTVPKLELSAALLLAELVNNVIDSFSEKYEVHCWSDSMVVLSWLREESSNFNVFVANRVSRIQTLTNQMTWHHVPTDLNPADILSRGASPEELLRSKLWQNGPNFLKNDCSKWPVPVNLLTDLPERKRTVLIASSISDWFTSCKHHNSFTKMQRIFGYVYKFVILKFSLRSDIEHGPLTPLDLKMGTQLLIRNIQQLCFAAEYKALRANKNISPSSKLYSLAPFMDPTNLIRVGGRLENSCLDFEAKHPIILPKLHPLTQALIMESHQKLLHAGPQCLLASIRQQYWPLGGRKAVSSVIAKCIRCFRLKPKYAQHLMGSLPRDRVQPNRAFHTTGIDFCGPFFYKSEVRSRPPVKCYICIFICFSTKASHLEVVSELSTSAFLSALKRFICTRGKPQTIWSDNATNFVGAKNELAELKQLFFSQSHLEMVHQKCLDDGISWKFIPPRSPHFGGLWEAAVKAAKFHFRRTVGLSILTFDEIRTLVCQISAILNSRPLCPISDDPNDLDVLTPGHFLIGAPLTSIIEPEITKINTTRLTRWQRVCFMQQIFWKKWSSAYLTLLQERSKWRASTTNIANGDMVVIKDENLPPLKWQMGRVTEAVVGDDGVVRVAFVRTSNRTMKIAVAKLAVLPIEQDSVESQSLPTGGGCLSQPHP